MGGDHRRGIDEWFARLRGEEQAEVIAKVELLKVLGPQLRRRHADTLGGSKHANMRELRADTGRHVLRVAYAFDPERNAVLLVGGDKAGVGQRRFYKQLIARAGAVYDRHLARLKQRRKRRER